MTEIEKPPLPWTVDEDDILNGMVFIPISDANGVAVCEVTGDYDERNDRFVIREATRARAALIVERVNGWEAALAALKDAEGKHKEDRQYITELTRRQCTALLEDPEGRSHSCHYLERAEKAEAERDAAVAALTAARPYVNRARDICRISAGEAEDDEGPLLAKIDAALASNSASEEVRTPLDEWRAND